MSNELMMIPAQLGTALAAHAKNLDALHGWEDITTPLQQALNTTQTATDALTAIHRLQRLSVIAEMGFGEQTGFKPAYLAANLPVWSGFAQLPVADEKLHMLAKLLSYGDPEHRSPLVVNLCDYGREIGEQIIRTLSQDRLDFEVTFDDPWFHRFILNNLDLHQIEKYALWRAGRSGEVDRSVSMRATSTSIPYDSSDEFKEKNRFYNDIVMSVRRSRDNKPFFTTTVLPTPKDAELDGMDYQTSLDLYFAMCQVDWTKIDQAHQVLIAQLNAASMLHITNNDGTDIRMDISGFTFCNSLVAKNVPGSEVFSAPHKHSVNGTIVAKGRFLPKGQKELVEDMRLVFQDGKVVEFDAAVGRDILAEIIATDEGSCYVGEIGIGTNPALQQHVVNSLMVEKIGGSFHVALGNAYQFTDYLGTPVNVDNSNRSLIHWDITTMLVGKQGRMTLDGHEIMANGHFIDPRLSALNGAA